MTTDPGTICNDCIQLTAGQCWKHSPPGVAAAIELDNAVACMNDQHAWMPWLKITDRSWVTYCIRCNRQEQYDV